ncbi:MAG: HEPN domain-containing protein [Chloroflexota bacterium]|nr:HEPN domain-containing protein [Chloroflexota bacterium]
MTYERLIKQGLIKTYAASEKEIRSLLEIATRDLSTAENMVGINPDWAYNISYNAMLQSSRALMLRKGYRPRGPRQHATVVQFVKQTVGEEHRHLVSLFDQMRRKRNRLVYNVANLVSEKECKEALSLAHEFVTLINNLINQEKN